MSIVDLKSVVHRKQPRDFCYAFTMRSLVGRGFHLSAVLMFASQC